MRADRLLSILLLLQVHQRITAHDLAKRLEVSERTIHRDMEALSATGIPVVAERGNGGGWSLLENYRTNLTGLSLTEIQALFLTTPSTILADLGLHKASEAALIKLIAALPSLSRRNAEDVRQRFYVDATGWNRAGEAVPALPVLQEAIWQEQKLQITYERGNAAIERVVDPLGLVAKGSIWYLVAAVDEQIRSYRVSRVREARLLEQSSNRPPHFDLAAYWTQSTADFKESLPRYAATVRVDPSILSYMRLVGRYARIEQISPPDEDGWVRLSMQFEEERGACEYVVSFGSQIEVVEPASLREKVIQVAESILTFYAQRVSRS
ncbi:MAG TPA: YafY family protein [Ktedonobacteraceae bacterium]|jgi:predicted DNA-binding transcriptional regulator YafY|nr:YafY family protein [Ktedonobacteraceae bacterium]